MAKFMLLLHDSSNGFRHLSLAERQETVEKLQEWTNRIAAAGKRVASDKLMEEGGKVLSMQKGRVTVTDGPYSETKEVLGGYFMIRAANYDEAVDLARDCPLLAFGRIEVRQTDPKGCGEE